MISYKERLPKIKTIMLDVDGVLTDNRIYMFNGEAVRSLHSKDGFILQLAMRKGFRIFIITGGKSVFTIHLHVVDLPLLYKIQTGLNMGNVYFKDNSATLIIKANKDIATLIEIFNGNLFLDKRKIQFAK